MVVQKCTAYKGMIRRVYANVQRVKTERRTLRSRGREKSRESKALLSFLVQRAIHCMALCYPNLMFHSTYAYLCEMLSYGFLEIALC